MSENVLARYQHRHGAPVLDRNAAELAVRGYGRTGWAIAPRDEVRRVATGDLLVVISVDHQDGLITARSTTGSGSANVVLSGVNVEVVEPAHHPPLADDCLEGLTLDEARATLTLAASDMGRYPQYTRDYFARWVFARARRTVKHRGQEILATGQRFLVDNDRADPTSATVWITRWFDGRGCAVSVDRHDVIIDPS